MRITLIPAAGSSSRMRGRDKLLELVDGKPILAILAARALATSDQVICTIPSDDHPRAEALTGMSITLVSVPDADQGMSHSLKAGAQAVPVEASGLMILPGDMPDITADDMNAVWLEFERIRPSALQCTTTDGKRGHPIVFARSMMEAFDKLSGDRGAFKLLNELGDDLLYFPLAGDKARLDLDTQEDWEAWRALGNQRRDLL